jgi:hypothetical protein
MRGGFVDFGHKSYRSAVDSGFAGRVAMSVGCVIEAPTRIETRNGHGNGNEFGKLRCENEMENGNGF